MTKDEALDKFSSAARECLELGVDEVDLCFFLEGTIDQYKQDVHEELERAAA